MSSIEALTGLVLAKSKSGAKANRMLIAIALVALDLFIMAACMLIAVSAGFEKDVGSARHFLFLSMLLAAMVVLTIKILKLKYHTSSPCKINLGQELRFVFVGAASQGLILFFSGQTPFKTTWATTWLLVLFLAPCAQQLAKHCLNRLGLWGRGVTVIFIDGCVSRLVKRQMDAIASYDVDNIIHVYNSNVPVQNDNWIRKEKVNVPVVSLQRSALTVALHELNYPTVALVFSNQNLTEVEGLVDELLLSCRSLILLPDSPIIQYRRTRAQYLEEQDKLTLYLPNNLAGLAYRYVKRGFDMVVSLILLLLLSPLMLWITLLVRKDGGPAVYGHERVGQAGKKFKCLKFRSMIINSNEVLKQLLESDPQARAEWDKDFKLRNDPRITTIGHFIRKTSLDELPQLWNVVKGEMSLVGPRPIVTNELDRYGENVGFYLAAKPGLTGLWQVSGRNDVSYNRRVEFDVNYAKNWSFMNDVVILFKTVLVVLRKDGAY